MTQNKRGRGRPATLDKYNYTRATFIVNKEQLESIKEIAFREKKHKKKYWKRPQVAWNILG